MRTLKGQFLRSLQSRAFTLVELLVVMAIIGLISVLTIPALSSLSNAGSINRAASGISLLLDQSRTYAMAHNTYVWVGFAPDTTLQRLTVGVVAGTTGDVDDLISGSTSPLARLQSYDHLKLQTISGLAGMSTSEDDISSSQVTTFQQATGGTTVNFSYVLQFGPKGEATINKTPGSSHWIQIGLQPLRGNAVNPDVAVIQVAALTGQVQIFRP